ncbi:sarcosine oxidase subunit gamma [Oceaniradius stylonematis]|uniref:Sarcosine oxidase subunit gamma n=1 Tax=Oceaniradius stylonematis TaxID=2184161 RepID=A0A3A8AJ53_9HYPH|nr:sarcosine oxidase subunit gamma family protein [Oceaniradius stylonematis]RKF05721.1 sarcosine oxidase subunit gamma [Oceaniradius stylonematis]
MAEPFVSTPVITDAAESPLAGHYEQGEFGNLDRGARVTLTERFALAICDVCAWPGSETKAANAIKRASGASVTKTKDAIAEDAQAFQHAPGRWSVVAQNPALPEALAKAVGENGTVVDLSHGRTVLRIDGRQSRRALSKLFPIDFRSDAFPLEKGLATRHHEIFAQIQRVGEDAFDIIVFRSYARAFWHALRKASEEVGYAVA